MNTKELIDAALKRIGVLDAASNQEAQGAILTDALMIAQQMVDAWNNEGMMVPYRTLETFDAPTANFVTIGTGGTWDTTRPLEIEVISGRDAAGTDYPLERTTVTTWMRIPVKSTVARPTRFYFEKEYPLARIRFDSVPDPNDDFKVMSLKPIADLPALTVDLTYPPGWDRALRLNLAVELAGEFDAPIDSATAILAADAKRKLKQAQSRPVEAKVDGALTQPGYGRYDIETGPGG